MVQKIFRFFLKKCVFFQRPSTSSKIQAIVSKLIPEVRDIIRKKNQKSQEKCYFFSFYYKDTCFVVKNNLKCWMIFLGMGMLLQGMPLKGMRLKGMPLKGMPFKGMSLKGMP